ncbi:MAG: hypothetical protein C0625_02125 [Arcobacter sp.]|nr:MAG: hypothetical protein C0625_02125 [Arcobacter sp.]
MADIEELEQWEDGVYQLETTDPVEGGADGVDNKPHKHLANRTVYLKSKLEKSTFASMIIASPSNVVPDGFLECNGAALSRTVYADLFAKIGTTYGVGNGSSTFNIPDLRGEFIRGLDNGRGVDSGRGVGSFQGDAIRNIIGSFVMGDSSGRYNFSSANGVFSTAFSSTGVNNSGNTAFSVDAGVEFDVSNVVPTASENRPRNVAMMYCIKY